MFDMLCAKSADSVDAAKFNHRDGSFKTPLAICASQGNHEFAAALLKHGAGIQSTTYCTTQHYHLLTIFL